MTDLVDSSGTLQLPRARAAGFTLIELMTTVAVAAILLTLAAPSFMAFQRNAELTSTANSFAASMAAARAEAMKRQLNAFVRPASGGDWAQGWSVYVDSDWDFVYSASTDVMVSQWAPMSSKIAVTTNTTDADATSRYLMFSASGFLRNASGAIGVARVIELTNTDGERRIVLASPAGRVRVCNPATDAACTTSDAF